MVEEVRGRRVHYHRPRFDTVHHLRVYRAFSHKLHVRLQLSVCRLYRYKVLLP